MVDPILPNTSSPNLNQYEILDSISINDQRSWKEIVQWINKNYRNEYSPQQRLVITIKDKLATYKVAQLISLIDKKDISRCFVVVITDQSNVIDTLNEHKGFVLVSVSPIVYTDEQIPPNLCAHAWAGFWLWPNGEATVCCLSNRPLLDHNGDRVNIKTHTLTEIYQSPTLVDLRKDLLEGGKPKSCQACWKNEDQGKPSRRQLASYALGDVEHSINWDRQDNFMFVGGHLGNICNLSCRTCNPSLSSQWAVENIKYGTVEEKNINKLLLKNNSWPITHTDFWHDLRCAAPNIMAYEFLGGEPLLLKQNVQFIEWLIHQGHSKNSVFRITTNGTNLPSVLCNPNNYRQLEITFSIDDIFHRFEYQRHGADWNLVSDNLRHLVDIKNQRDNIKIGINTVISIMNIFYLPELLTWIEGSGVDHWHYEILQGPTQLALDKLSKKQRAIIIERLEQVPQRFRTDLAYLLHALETTPEHEPSEFWNYTKMLDDRRGQSFIATHSEIVSLLTS